jgi:hypothetical protein
MARIAGYHTIYTRSLNPLKYLYAGASLIGGLNQDIKLIQFWGFRLLAQASIAGVNRISFHVSRSSSKVILGDARTG